MEKLLPAALICSDFIGGMDNCDYEDYLREIVNSSAHFLQKSDGESYHHPSSEAHGECDCISTHYSFDFKLAVSGSAMQGRNIFSSGITEIYPGVTSYGVPKVSPENPDYHPIKATRIHSAIRNLNPDDLTKIRNAKSPGTQVDRDIKAFLKILETPKNILLFFPYELYMTAEIGLEQEYVDAVSKDFCECLKYRRRLLPKYDTYLVFLANGNFILTIFEDSRLKHIESIPECKSKIYMNIKDKTEIWR